MQYQHHPKNLGQNQLKLFSKYHLVGLLTKKKDFFLPNFVLFKIPLTCLTNSALSTTQVTRSTLKGPRDLKM